MKYVYQAIFTPDEDGSYEVDIPDLENCFKYGTDLADAVFMAEDVVSM